ncbi:MAG: V-type ATP synthase subunit A [Candidatus Aenigmarchaeota archaeon]|nr:V-type ATP synthase subunit A [Candidatus Aenigmarchaeota archaeon]
MANSKGRVLKISGPVALVELEGSKIGDLVYVGKKGLLSEVIRIESNHATLAIYEDATGTQAEDSIEGTNTPMMLALGPGLIGGVYDGLGRRLETAGEFMSGTGKKTLFGINQRKKWRLENTKSGRVKQGDVICTVRETESIVHKIFAQRDGKVTINKKSCSVCETYGELVSGKTKSSLKLMQSWPLKKRRPYIKKEFPSKMLVTGQRVIDSLFPVARGGVAAMPGGFGSGKTVLGHQIAKHSDADIVIYVGCGERGNEMARALEEFRELCDPNTGIPLMERSILVANTSNMPVTARISSIYFGALVGEYYRDMGYNVLLMVDSTSRWAEALREISGRLEELPGEEGYPVYLESLIASFYGRAGVVKTTSKTTGSLTIIGAVSPSGGDFSEPVTQATKKSARSFWTLNTNLAYRRHYPAVDWITSYTSHLKALSGGIDAAEKQEMLSILQKEKELERIARLVGYDALTKKDLFLIYIARAFREGFLQQNAYHEVDRHTSIKKQQEMFQTILYVHKLGQKTFNKGKDLDFSVLSTILEKVSKMKNEKKEVFADLRHIAETKLGEKE